MNNLLEEIKVYIEKLFENHPPEFLYHNLQHTMEVVNIVEEIADESGISREEKDLLLIAAWFHDAGYPENIPQHEEKSAEYAERFLNKLNYPAEKVDIIRHLILSTKMPQNPKTELEKIICDADIAYIGKDNLLNRISLLRKEWETTINETYPDSEWLEKNISFIESNTFHTGYAKKKFGDTRKKNLALLKKLSEETTI